MRTFRKGEIFWIETEKNIAIAKKVRPGVIVSADDLNDHLPTVEIVFLTTHPKGENDCHCMVGGAEKPSIALCENVMTVYGRQVGDYIGTCTDHEVEMIDRCIMRGLGVELEEPREVVDIVAETERERLQKELAKVKAQNELLREMYNDLLMTGR